MAVGQSSGAIRISGFFEKQEFKDEGVVARKLTNAFWVVIDKNSYFIHASSPDLGLPCFARGDSNECVTVATGVRLNGSPLKGGVPNIVGGDVKDLPLVKLPEIQAGGYPARGSQILKVMWLAYAAGQLYGSNWLDKVDFDNYAREELGMGLVEQKLLLARSWTRVTNSSEEFAFVEEAELYSDPVRLVDGKVGRLSPPYDNGYPCVKYSVNSWTNIAGVAVPERYKFAICGPSKGGKTESDVAVYSFTTATVVGVLDEQHQSEESEIHELSGIWRVKDWRILGVEPLAYKITNGIWPTIDALPNHAKIIKEKSGILAKVLSQKAPKELADSKERINSAVIKGVLIFFAATSGVCCIILVAKRR